MHCTDYTMALGMVTNCYSWQSTCASLTTNVFSLSGSLFSLLRACVGISWVLPLWYTGRYRSDNRYANFPTTWEEAHPVSDPTPERVGLAKGSPDADQSRSRKGLRYRRMHRHRGV